MKKSIVIYLSALLAVILLLPSCIGGSNGGPTMHVTDPTMSAATTTAQSTTAVTTTENPTQTTTEITEPDISIPVETHTVAEGEEVMLVSADPSNPFIEAVVQKYGISPDRLVAFYASSMQTDGNLVFEFDGSVNSGGKPIRTTKTLKNIYTVSPAPELLAKKATGTVAEGNEYSERDSKYCELFVKWIVFKVYAKDIQNA